MNDPTFTDTSISRCAYYRRTCGLPAGIHPEAGRIVVKAGVVGAITMPAALGRLVRDDMLFRGGPLGPIVAHIRCNCTLSTRSAQSVAHAVGEPVG